MLKRNYTWSLSKTATLAIIIFFALVSLCPAEATGKDADRPSILIKKEDNGKSFTVPLGACLDVELPFLGSAGYAWQIENLDIAHLELIKEDTRSIPNGNRIGGPVLGIWRFKAVNPGRTTLTMKYYRPWEGVGSALDQFTVKIEIQ
jgi:predicted secreted protein